MQLGCCIQQFDAVPLVAAAGLAYYELPVARVVMGSATVEDLEHAVQSYAIRPLAYNVLFPPDLPLLDGDAQSAVHRYLDEAFRRLARLGGQVVVFGSGQARSIPPGMEPAIGAEKLAALVNDLAGRAEAAGFQLALEPLRRAESNIWNSISETVAFLDTYGIDRVGVVADFYHMLEERESFEALARHRTRIVHAHLADTHRAPPGYGAADVGGFLATLQSIGYTGLCSLECRWEDFARQLPVSARVIRDLCGIA